MRNKSLSTVCLSAGLGMVICGFAPDATAQAYPTRPIRIVVGLGPGGASDLTARMVGQKMTAELGQTVVVENRTGASGIIANEKVATASPDGYTLAMVTTAIATTPALQAKLPYDIQRDFAPVALVVTSAHVLVANPKLPVKTVAELINLARAQPGKLSYGSTGIGSAQHIAGEFFNTMAKTDIKHVAYKGGAENVLATVSGEVELTYGNLSGSIPFINSDRLRPLGITGTKRSPLLPNVPTISEAGLTGYDSVAWYGILAPARTPDAIIRKLNSVIVKSGQTEEQKQAFIKMGMEPQTLTPEQFGEFIRTETAKNTKLIREAKIQAN